jgi:sugar (pentulose or hexulose) kinase
MTKHLTEEQFARCFVEGASGAAWEHLTECSECQTELDRFGGTVASLRLAVRGRVDAQAAAQAFDMPMARHTSKTAWALAAAAVLLLGIAPFLMEMPHEALEASSAEPSPEALMNAISLHLSRTMPSPMEPMMSLIPSDVYITESGEIQ